MPDKFDSPVGKTAVAALAVAVWVSPSTAGLIPTLWGVDEDATLFSIADYTNPTNTFTRFGRLKWNDNGTIRNVGDDIEAFTVSRSGMGYFALNGSLGGLGEPVLLRFDLNNASTSGPNVADVVGRIDLPANSDDDGISGLTFHPGTGLLYGLVEDDDIQRLLQIDPTSGNVIDLGLMTGLGHAVENAQELVFDSVGNLYIADDRYDHLYRIDPVTAAILEVVDADLRGGLGVNDIEFEGLAWDPVNQRLIGFSDRHALAANITLESGNNVRLFDFSDLPDLEEIGGIGFMAQPIPTPGTLALLALAALCRRRRPRSSH